MKKIMLLMFSLLILQNNAWARQVNIAILTDGSQGSQNPSHGHQLQQEIRALTKLDFDVQFVPSHQRSGQWQAAKIKGQLDQLLSDKDVDLIITLGPIASHLAATRKHLAKPVIATTIIDAQLQGLPFDSGHSGVSNLNYLSNFRSIERDISALQRLTPFKSLAILVDDEVLKTLPQLREKGAALAIKKEIKITLVPLQKEVGNWLSEHPGNIDAVYFTPSPRLSRAHISALAQQLIGGGLPSFSYLGGQEVEEGLLATLATGENRQRFARRIALNVQRILLGEEAGSLPVAFSQTSHFTINMATARALDIWPDWDLMAEAKLLNKKTDSIDRQLTLAKVAREARQLSLDLQAKTFAVSASAKDVDLARAQLYPQFDLVAQALVIDEDRAQASFGSQAEKTTSGSLTLSQVLYSDKALANLEIQKQLQQGRIDNQQQLELDVVHEATSAYLTLLRAQTLVQIQEENLRVTRSNLELASMRRRIGVSGPADLYRWQSEAALNRQDLVSAQARLRQSKTILNRLLNQPQEAPFISHDIALDDSTLLVGITNITATIRNPRDFTHLRNYLVHDGLSRSPELLQFDAAIAAQQRQITAHRRSYWAPDVMLQGGATETFSESGAGSNATLPLGFGGNQDDSDWNLAVAIKLPLFSGGSRSAEVSKAGATLQQLKLERQSTATRLEAAIRNALHQAGASYTNIDLANDAEYAAEKNLGLVTDAYAQGTVAIIQLIDAQRAALVAQQGATDARYQFLLDLMSTQRSTGQFGFFMTETERAEWINRLHSNLAETQR